MKKTLKIVLPILLIFALLVTGYWFFFRYRTDITTGFLRNLAEAQMVRGRYSAAIRCYRWANELAPQDAALALRLAEAYEKSGNYSKTESVLVHAIEDSPDETELYVKLSRVYVAQDKLLDAQRLLDGVTSKQVLAELSTRRPAAPTVSPEGAFYNEYITVELSLSDPEAACYLSLDGGFPSLESGSFTGSLNLPGGETTLCAVAVKDGLVSPATYQGYTIAGVVEDVSFHDEVLLAATQELLNKGSRTLRTDDLWNITEMTLPEGMADTQDLRLYTGMKKLIGRDLEELDYSFLPAMTELRYLELEHCVLSTESLEAIAQCPKLETLILANCGVSNVEPLGALSSLRILDLSENSISAINGLVSLSGLEELYLGHNALSDIPVLRGLKSLKILDLSYNALSYVGGVSACSGLERLNLSHNRLSSVTPVSALVNLIWLNASHNSVDDATMLTPCKKLQSFIMTDNKLSDVAFLSGCADIREINIDNNDVTAVPPLAKDCPLESFSAAHNFLEDLSGLAGLKKLEYVNADYNNIRDISVLKDCPALTLVNVYGTYIRSGGALADQGVTVNYTPEF